MVATYPAHSVAPTARCTTVAPVRDVVRPAVDIYAMIAALPLAVVLDVESCR